MLSKGCLFRASLCCVLKEKVYEPNDAGYGRIAGDG